MSQLVHMLINSMMKADDVGEVFISGVIYPYKYDSSVTAKETREALAKVKNAKRLNIHVNSPGGVITEAVDMMDQIRAHAAKEKNVHVIMADSAATLLLLVATHVSMIEGGEIMIHRPKAGMWGDADDMHREYEMLAAKEKEICSMYASFCKQPESDVWEKMKKETWFTAQQAKDYGFVHEIVKVSKDNQQSMITRGQMVMLGYTNVPEWVMNRLPDGVEEPKGLSGRPLETFGASPQGEGAGMVGATNTEGSAAKAAFSNTENKGDKLMTKDELKAQHPVLVAEIENDAKAVATTAERERIQGLEDVAMVGSEKLLAEAKFEKPCTVAEFAINQAKSAKAKGASFMEKRKEETKPMAQVGSGEGTTDLTEDQEAEMEANKMLAAAGIKTKA